MLYKNVQKKKEKKRKLRHALALLKINKKKLLPFGSVYICGRLLILCCVLSPFALCAISYYQYILHTRTPRIVIKAYILVIRSE